MWKYFRKFSWLNKYGIPMLLACVFLSFLGRDSIFMMMFRDIITELVVIYFCFREFFEAFRRSKCMWQVASICGLLTHCILNIIYYVSGRNEGLIEYFQYGGFTICSLVVIGYLIKDNYGTRGT